MARINIPFDSLIRLYPGGRSRFSPDKEVEIIPPSGFSDAWLVNFFAHLYVLGETLSETAHIRLALSSNPNKGHWFFMEGVAPFALNYPNADGILKDRIGTRIGRKAYWPKESFADPRTAAHDIFHTLIPHSVRG